MIRHDVVARGVRDERVVAAMARVPREEFVLPSERTVAYADHAMPIGHGQTISQPFVVAVMLEALGLQPDDRLLEIGCGSGYALAVASLACHEVVGIERVHALAVGAAERLARLGYGNARVVEGDGSAGWADGAPYDAILVSAAAPEVPPALLGELADGGRLVIPVGRSRLRQQLLRVRRRGDTFDETDLGGVAFVPLVGEAGYPR